MLSSQQNTKGKATAFATLTPFTSIWRRLLEWAVIVSVRIWPRPEPAGRDRTFLHYASWVPLSKQRLGSTCALNGEQAGALLFMSAFTGDLGDYLMGFTEGLPSEMDALWDKCKRWPGASHYNACLSFIVDQQRQSAAF